MMFRRPARMLQSFLRHNSASAPLYHALARQFAIPRRVLAGRVVFEPIPSRPSPPAGADLCLVHGIWLDQNAGADGWAMTPSGERGVRTTRSRSIWPTRPSRVLLWPAGAWFDGAGLTIGATPNQIFDWIASSNRGEGDPIAPTARRTIGDQDANSSARWEGAFATYSSWRDMRAWGQQLATSKVIKTRSASLLALA
jgi:hypothetical protein